MKATPEGVRMFELRPASAEEMAHAWGNLAKLQRVSDALKLPKFSEETLAELASILNDREAARLCLVWARVGNYGDKHGYGFERLRVTELFIRDGIHFPKGKRPRPGSSEFIEMAAPMLIYFGLKPSASERSKLVRALRVIADGLGIPGDPREAIKRLKRQERQQAKATQEAVLSAARRGLSFLRGIGKSDYPPPKEKG